MANPWEAAEIAGRQAERLRAKEAVPEHPAVALLRELQWYTDREGETYCVTCGWYVSDRGKTPATHAPDCRLAAILAGSRPERALSELLEEARGEGYQAGCDRALDVSLGVAEIARAAKTAGFKEGLAAGAASAKMSVETLQETLRLNDERHEDDVAKAIEAERESCAQVTEERAAQLARQGVAGDEQSRAAAMAVEGLAALIRARGIR